VGLAIPLSALSAWLILARRSSIRTWALLFAGSIICLVPSAIWIGFLNQRLGWDAVYEVFWTNNFGRFTGSMGSHVHPFYYYLVKFPLQFLPWTLFIPLAVLCHIKKAGSWRLDDAALFIVAWFAVPFMLLSLSSGKRGIYLLPLYPAAALFVGVALGSILEEKVYSGKWFRVPFLFMLGLLIIAGLAYGGVGVYFEQSFLICAVLSIPGLFLGVWAIRRFLRRDLSGSFRWAAAALLVLLITCGYGVYPLFDRVKSFIPLLQCCDRYMAAGTRLELFEPTEALNGAAVFYLKRNVPQLHGKDELKEFLESGEDAMAVCAERRLEDTKELSILRTFDIGHRTYLLIKKNRLQIAATTGGFGG